MKILKFIFFIALVFFSILVFNHFNDNSNDNYVTLANDYDILEEIEVEGKKYSLFTDGNFYEYLSGNWKFAVSLYNPDFYENNYEKKDGSIYIKHEGKLYSTYSEKKENFENAKSIHDFINLERAWTTFTLLSPKANSVKEYIKLKNCILNKSCTFLDNSIKISNSIVHSGKNSMEFFTKGPGINMITSKSSISTDMLHYKKGDDIWFSGWFYIDKGMPSTIVDLENSFFEQSPGPRLYIRDGKYLSMELKYANKIQYKQTKGEEIEFPQKKWVNIRFHYKLSNTDDGIITIWQDNNKLIDVKGKNLPTFNSVLNSLELGITATDNTTLMYVDDIIISNKEIISK